MATRKAKSATPLPWQWPEETWRGIVGKVRAGRSLRPRHWKDGARVAVALSFDSDHESGTLREGESSPGKLSQGQYGARQGVPLSLVELGDLGAQVFFFQFQKRFRIALFKTRDEQAKEAADDVGQTTEHRMCGWS